MKLNYHVRMIAGTVFVIMSIFVFCAAVGKWSAFAATPSSGTIGPNKPAVTWQGAVYQNIDTTRTAVPAVDSHNCGIPTVECDHFFLTVGASGDIKIEINWSNPGDDFDLYVYDRDGVQVGMSNTFAYQGMRVTRETVVLHNLNAAKGPYDIRVLPMKVSSSGYTGAASFSQTKPRPARATGGLRFEPAIVKDPQRSSEEPSNFIDRDGDEWDTGFMNDAVNTATAVVHRSTDSGDSFHITAPTGVESLGDVDLAIDDQGYAYFSQQPGQTQCAVSNDKGNTWRSRPECTALNGDRPWYAIDNGTDHTKGLSGASDNTVFMAIFAGGTYIYSSPGSTGASDPTGGLNFVDSSDNTSQPIYPAFPSQLRFEPVRRNLYVVGGESADPNAYQTDGRLTLLVGHVNPGQRTNIHYDVRYGPKSPGGGRPMWDNYTTPAFDKDGNVYIAWVDSADRNVYFAASTDTGRTWGPAIQVNGNDAASNMWVWTQGGANGRLAIAWLGNASDRDSQSMPSWFNDRSAASAYKWYGYVAVISNALGNSPTIYQTRFTEKPMHFGFICRTIFSAPTNCYGYVAPDPIRPDTTMADFFGMSLDRDGRLRITYDDTTSQHHSAHLFSVRQIGGPSLLGGTVNRPAPANPMSDPIGDAQWPHYAAVAGAGPNQPQLDFTQLRLSQPNADTLRVEMTVKDLSLLLPPAGKTSAFWLTRFQAKSVGEGGEEAYRIFYVGAESVGGAAPTFFAGSGNAQDPTTHAAGNGCLSDGTFCIVTQYPVEMPAAGAIVGNTIKIDIPIQGAFGPNRPIKDNVLYSVTAFSGGRNNATTDIYADVDATRAFDFTLASPVSCRDGDGEGDIDNGKGKNAHFKFHHDECDRQSEREEFRDDDDCIDFKSTQVESVTFDDATHSLNITGLGTNNGVPVAFTISAIDSVLAWPGAFSITLSDGYSLSGPPTSGEIQIR